MTNTQLLERWQAEQKRERDKIAAWELEYLRKAYKSWEPKPRPFCWLRPMGMDESLADSNRRAAWENSTKQEKRIAKHL